MSVNVQCNTKHTQKFLFFDELPFIDFLFKTKTKHKFNVNRIEYSFGKESGVNLKWPWSINSPWSKNPKNSSATFALYFVFSEGSKRAAVNLKASQKGVQ